MISSPSDSSHDPAKSLLRHTVATVAYRGGKAVRGASPVFANFALGDRPKTPVQILAHIGDLFDWAITLANGAQLWKDSTPLPWDREVERFHITLRTFDERLASPTPLACAVEKLFQGPVADALTHVGQLTMLRRLAATPMKGENYFKADIVTGRTGAEQTTPKREFD